MPSTDNTVRILDNFYNIDITVSAAEYDAIHGFFTGYTTNSTVAKAYTDILFRISSLSDTPAVDLLSQFQGLDAMRISFTMAYYLNTVSDNKTVLYGVNNVLTANEKVQRNIIQ
jgi:hypothetical protein